MKWEIGFDHDFEVRRENYDSDLQFTVLFVSDLHFNKFSGPIVNRLISAISELNATIILFGGDYVDTRNGFMHLEKLLQSVAARNNVFAIAGNHDIFYGIEKIRSVMIANNVYWLEKPAEVIVAGKRIAINAGANINADFSILLVHKPADVQPLRHIHNLVFAGHLHGCQFVFSENEKGLYPGRLFYKWNILKKTYGKCTYLVSKGMGDTLPVRYNCKRDIIFVEVGAIAGKESY